MSFSFDIYGPDLFEDDNFRIALDQILETAIHSFTAAGLLSALKKNRSPENLQQLREYLRASPLVFRMGEKEEEERWLTRAGLFTGREFAARITKAEIAAGIFFPGSRCVPFANPRIPQGQFHFTADGRPLQSILIDTTEEEVSPYYVFYGEEFIPQYLAMDNPESTSFFRATALCREEHGSFPLVVPDMREFYWENEVRPGDDLILRVEDWPSASFSVRVRHKSEADGTQLQRWDGVLEKALERSFRVAGPSANIEEQLASAFFLAEEELFRIQPDDLYHAVSGFREIGFFSYGVETRLWKERTPFPVPADWELWLHYTVTGGNDLLYQETGIPLTAEILNAYILDALYRQEENADPLLRRLQALCTDGESGNPDHAQDLSMPGMLPPGSLSLRSIIQPEFRYLRNTYNFFQDNDTGPVRAKLLAMYQRILAVVRKAQSVGMEPGDLSDQDVVILAQLAEHVLMCIDSFYHDPDNTEDPIPEESLTGMEETLEDMEVTVYNAAANFQRRSKSGKR